MVDYTIGKIILEQLGGAKFITMTGAKNFVALENGLRFSVPNSTVNDVVILLTPLDEYDVQYRIKSGPSIRVVKEEKGIYCDQLQDSFTRNTGLDTHL